MDTKLSNASTFLIAAIVAVVLWVVSTGPPIQIPDVRMPDVSGDTGQWHMEQVMPWPEFVTPAMTYTPGPETEMFWDDGEMPPIPDCSDLGVDECRWEAHNMQSPSGDMIQVELRSSNGKVMGRAELLRVQTYEYPELQALQRMGYHDAWIARIEVLNVFRGNGLGRLMWKAGDAALKIASGGGAIRVFSDRAGWGQAIMKLVPKELIILSEAPMWAYIIE